MSRSVPLGSILLLLCATCVSACKPALLPNTTLEDTKENRAIAEFVAHYQKAVESRAPDQVLALVAEDYFEDMGTVDASDDYGLEQLEARLSTSFEHARAVHLEMFLQRVSYDEDRNLYSVDYRYSQRALLAFEAGEQWVTHSDVNRLVLRPRIEDKDSDQNKELGGFLIVSGL
ncbi:MAG: hypothetical protein ACO3JL_12340 [Myxococcota bacterium]